MQIMTVANSKRVKGGITSVVNSLIDGIRSHHSHIKMARHASYVDYRSPAARVAYSLLSMAKFVFVLPFYRIYHLHSAADGSFYRKSIYTMLCKLAGKKVIFHIHGSSFEDFHNCSRFNAGIIRMTLNRADEIVVLSAQMKRLTESYCENRNITILPNPITIPSEIPVDASSKGERVQLLFLGEIGPRKGIYDLIEAVSRLPADIRSGIVLHICGNNEIEKAKKMIQEKNVAESCIVHGWIDGAQKDRFLRNADIYVLPSYHEGLPVSILEAMAYSLPVISTNVGGIPEIVRNQENGVIISPGDIDRLAEAIAALVKQPELRKQMGCKSRETAAPHNITLVAEELSALYRKLSN